MFKDIKKKITEAGQNAVSQTKKLAETVDLNAKINKRQGDLNKELLELGKQFYLNKKNSVPKAFADQFAAINGVREDIANMKQRVAELKEKDDVTASEETAPETKAEKEVKVSEPAKETPVKKPVAKKPTAETKPAAKKPAPKKLTAKATETKKPAAKKPAPKKPAAKKPAANKEVSIPVFEASGRNCINCSKPLGEEETTCPACGAENPIK